MKSRIDTVLNHLFARSINSKLYRDFRYELHSHPAFPTLKSISETLESFGIENVPVRLKPHELDSLDSPYLAYVNVKGHSELAYVEPIDEQRVRLKTESSRVSEESMFNFASDFTGIGVLLNLKALRLPNPKPERRSQEHLFRFVLGLFLISFASIIAYGLATRWTNSLSGTGTILMFVSSLLGLGVSSLLTLKDFGQLSDALDSVCRIGDKVDCNTVLTSRASKIYGWVKWSDVGLVYFLSALQTLIFGYYDIFTFFALAASSYIIVSLYQQFVVLKIICPLCLGVLTILLFQLLISFSYSEFSWNWEQFTSTSLIFLMVGTLWLTLKAFLQSNRSKEHLEFRYNRMKNVPEVMGQIIQSGKKIIFPDRNSLYYLSFGSSYDEALKVSAFLSLHCGHCRRIFSELDQQLSLGMNLHIDLIINFDPINSEQVDCMEEVARQYYSGEKESAWDMLRTWYSSLKEQAVKKQTEEPSEHLKKLFFTTKRLMKINQIDALPVLIVEGFENSGHYQLEDMLKNREDLKSFISPSQEKIMINK